jgi:WD40 repeat protein
MSQVITQTTAIRIHGDSILIAQGHRCKVSLHNQIIRVIQTTHRIHHIKVFDFIYLIGEKQITILDFHYQVVNHIRCRDWIQDVLFVPEMQRFFVLFSHNFVDELDLDWNLIRTVYCEAKSLLYSGELFYDSALKIVSGTIYNQALIWDLSGKVSQTLVGHEGVLFRCRFDARGARVVTCSDDRTVRVWNLANHDTTILHGHSGRVWDAKFAGPWIISVAEDASCRVWDKNGPVAVWEGHGNKNVWSVDVDPMLHYVVTGGGDGGVRRWSLLQLEENRISDTSMLHVCNTEWKPDLSKQDYEPKNFKLIDENRMFIVTETGAFLLYHRLTNSSEILYQDLRFRLSPQLAVSRDFGVCANMNGLLVFLRFSSPIVHFINLANLCFRFYGKGKRSVLIFCDKGNIPLVCISTTSSTMVTNTRSRCHRIQSGEATRSLLGSGFIV